MNSKRKSKAHHDHRRNASADVTPDFPQAGGIEVRRASRAKLMDRRLPYQPTPRFARPPKRPQETQDRVNKVSELDAPEMGECYA